MDIPPIAFIRTNGEAIDVTRRIATLAKALETTNHWTITDVRQDRRDRCILTIRAPWFTRPVHIVVGLCSKGIRDAFISISDMDTILAERNEDHIKLGMRSRPLPHIPHLPELFDDQLDAVPTLWRRDDA